MAVTVSSIVTNLDTQLGDSSTDRISQAERLQAITQSTAWLLEELGNEHMVNTYNVSYLDTVNNYKVTTTLADLLTGADLRRSGLLQTQSFARKSPRELAEEIGQRSKDPSWAIERYDGDAYLVINFEPENTAHQLFSFDDVTEGGTWTADSANSDATNITQDVNEKKQGSGSLNFDVDVSQSVNDYATIYMPDASSSDLSIYEDTASFIFWVYIPDVTYTSSFTLYWGSDESSTPSTKANYWSVTASTDINGNAFVQGWNQVKVNWISATKTGSPDASAIVYYEIRMTYNGSQADDTDFRYDFMRIVKPEILTFHYISWDVGTSSGGTNLSAFTATTDIPFFSGRYDQYRYPVAHMAASILFSGLRLRDESVEQELKALKALERYRKNFESSKVRELKTFKVLGVNLRRNRRIGKIPKIR